MKLIFLRILVFWVLLLSCSAPEPDISETIFPVKEWISVSDGTIPLVIIAPHGGNLKPSELPDRNCENCVYVNDLNTMELAQAINSTFYSRTGKRPFLIINKLHRTKFDGNRDLTEATGGYDPLTPFWVYYHNAIDTAINRALRLSDRALVIDLHGHGHAKQRLELGYLLSGPDLRKNDSDIQNLLPQSSVAGLTQSSGKSTELINGLLSLGASFETVGIPSVPSPSDRAPLSGDPYFNGGFNTLRYGSANGGPSDAIQIECHYTGIRNSSASIASFAEKFVTALLLFLEQNYPGN